MSTSDRVLETVYDLLFPDSQDTRIFIQCQLSNEAQEANEASSAGTSTFNPAEIHHDRIPSSIRIVDNLPKAMESELKELLREHPQVGDTKVGMDMAPQVVFNILRRNCLQNPLDRGNEATVSSSTIGLRSLVGDIFEKLKPGHSFWNTAQEAATNRTVITDNVFKVDNVPKILFELKSPKVFDKFIRQLLDEVGQAEDSAMLFSTTEQVSFEGYRAILAKVSATVVS